MIFTIDDYEPPLHGHLDTRRLAMFADNRDLTWAFASERTDAGSKVIVTIGDTELDAEETFAAEHADAQTALDKAIDLALAKFGD